MGTVGGVGLLLLLAYATGVTQTALMWCGLARHRKVADAHEEDSEKMEAGDQADEKSIRAKSMSAPASGGKGAAGAGV